MKAGNCVTTENGGGVAYYGHAHRGPMLEGELGAPRRPTPEGRRHGRPPQSCGGSWLLDNRYELVRPAKRRRSTVAKMVEGEPPQPSNEASLLEDD
jgi:hypothetical protein